MDCNTEDVPGAPGAPGASGGGGGAPRVPLPAHAIPSLLSGGGGGGGGAGGPRARARVPAGETHDRAVQATNDAATESKFVCVQRGYFRDAYVGRFVQSPPGPRQPILNRGYYARYKVFRTLTEAFLRDSAGPCQVLNLGAGFDTLFFQLRSESPELLHARTRWIDVDFADVMARKRRVLATCAVGGGGSSSSSSSSTAGDRHQQQQQQQQPDGSNASGGSDAAGGADAPHAAAGTYVAVDADLRQVDSLFAVLHAAGFDESLPTLVRAECVFVYIDASETDPLIRRLAERLRVAAFLMYDPTNPHDAYGRTMLDNIRRRGAPLLGIERYPTPEAQVQRFRALGWDDAQAIDMDSIYYRVLEPADVARIEALEIVDELEEWHVLLQHYFVLCARRTPDALPHVQMHLHERSHVITNRAFFT